VIHITSINFNDLIKAAGDAGFDALPAGTYDVVVDTAAHKTASSGKEMITAQFKVENGPYASKSVFSQFVLSPDNANALSFWFRHMNAMGLGESYFQANPPLERVAADLTGRRCRVTLSIRQWQGQDRNQVDVVLPPLSNGQAPAVPSPAGNTVPAPAVSAVAVPGPPVPNVPATPALASSIPPPPDDLPF
jgi:hypothetical protein